MKIAIIAGHFMPEIGYQETYIAKALSKCTHEVCVFTSNIIAPSYRKILGFKKYNTGIFTDKKYRFRIHRLNSSFSFGSMVFSNELKRNVFLYKPDMIIILGIGQIFPNTVFKLKNNTSCIIISLMGNNKDFYSWNSLIAKLNSIKNFLTLKLIKKWVYRKAVKYSNKIFVYTNDTEEIVNSLLSKKQKTDFKNKIVKTTLGFDIDEFYFKSEDYFNIRSEYGIPEDAVLIVTVTRINKNKKIEFIIENIAKLQKAGISVYYIIIGFLNDQYAEKLKKKISNLEQKEKFICLPFLPHSEIRKIYCAADLGIWLQAAISIQEAMGTGLPVLLEDKGSVKHLIKESQNGLLFEKSQFYNVLEKYVYHLTNISVDQRLSEKKNISKFNKKRISYEAIVKKMLESAVLKE